MTFKKIDENTIRCVLTETDMEENDIGLEDFFSNDREKIHNFLETIMEEAKREIGYENEGSVLSMQLMPLPRNGLAITITGSKEQDFNDMLGNVQSMLKSMHDQIADEAGESDDTEEDEPKRRIREIVPPTCQVYKFDSLDAVEDYCLSVSRHTKNLKTSLYKSPDGVYYMEISKGRSSKANYESACIEAAEYAVRVDDGALFMEHMKEHFDILIPKKVIENLG